MTVAASSRLRNDTFCQPEGQKREAACDVISTQDRRRGEECRRRRSSSERWPAIHLIAITAVTPKSRTSTAPRQEHIPRSRRPASSVLSRNRPCTVRTTLELRNTTTTQLQRRRWAAASNTAARSNTHVDDGRLSVIFTIHRIYIYSVPTASHHPGEG